MSKNAKLLQSEPTPEAGGQNAKGSHFLTNPNPHQSFTIPSDGFGGPFSPGWLYRLFSQEDE